MTTELADTLASGGLPDGDTLSSKKQLLCVITPAWRGVVYTGHDDDVTLRLFYGRKFVGTRFWLDQGTQHGEVSVLLRAPVESTIGTNPPTWWVREAIVRFFDPNAARLLGKVRASVERYAREVGHDYDTTPERLARAMGATVVVESHRVAGQGNLNSYLLEAAE
ncbi:MAG: hypothetical protein JSV86_06580 [Gemmatimonadota bacterium]|nr:MAG: hypothetical protein JSV86_06580 [Gemmatimonadota bacterium]